MNYTALQTAVAEYLHRTDLSSGSPSKVQDFIERARVRIGRDLRSLEQIVTTTLSSFTNSVAALPTDYQDMVEVRSSDVPLRAVNLHELGYFLGTTTPSVYAIYNRNIHIPGATSADIFYFRQEAALSSGSTEHPTMAAHPQLWIYAAVREGAIFTHDLDLATAMNDAYMADVAAINKQAKYARFSAAPATVDSGRNVLAMGPTL